MHAHTTVSGTYAPAGAKTDPRQPAGQQAEAAQPMANYERRDRRRRGPRVFENNEISTNVSYQLRFFRNIVGQTQVQQGRRFCECIRCHPRHTSTNYHESRACPYPHPHSNTHRHRGNHTHTSTSYIALILLDSRKNRPGRSTRAVDPRPTFYLGE
jgi:hypothetical protein